MKKVDYIIIGQGLAGSLLGYELHQRGKTVQIFDGNKKNAASKVAIGLTNPITGKRLVKSWLIDDLLPFALSKYAMFEAMFEQSFIHHTKIARLIPNEDIFQQWQPNFQQAVKEGYIDSNVKSISFDDKTWRYFHILNAFCLDTVPLLNNIKQFFKSHDAIEQENIAYEDILLKENKVFLKNIAADGIIFCEGAAGNKNPFFEYLPFKPNKGEVIDVKLTDYHVNDVLKKNIFIVPEKDYWRIGSTYNRQFEDEQTTDKALAYFEKKLFEMTGKSYELVNHQAGVRPSTTDRRPFIGRHPTYKPFYIFNGFGSKGVSLIPYFASHFCNFLLSGNDLMSEVDCKRFLTA